MAAAFTSNVVIDESALRAQARLSVGRVLVVAVLLAAELAIVVWPLPLHVGQSVSGHWDSFFGVWRLAWIADAIRTPGVRLFDAPIFHPHGLTLAFSDAVLFPSLLAAPLRYAGLTPVLTFNIVLAAAFLTSGLALFALVRRLTGSLEAGLVSATIFTLAPYRLDHLDHLEMQAAAFMPAGLWLWHRAVDRQSAAAAAGAASMAVLQWLSTIYFGMLFAPYALVMCAIEWERVSRPRRARILMAMAIAGVVGVLVVAWYSSPYLANRAATGDREASVVAEYSATPLSYLAVHPRSALYGGLLSAFGSAETRLFPGLLALVLAGAGLARTPWSRRKWAYVAAGVVGFDLSLGTNGLLVPLLREVALPYRGIRAPARAGILVLLTVAVFAGWGTTFALARTRSRMSRYLVTATLLLVLVVEYRTPPDVWAAPPSGEAQHMGLTRGAVAIELPLALPERLDRSADAWYMVARIGAWPSLVNGYSGYYPPEYLTLADRIRLFPDDRAIREIARVGVTVLAVHERFYGAQFKEIVDALERRDDVERVGQYQEDRFAVVVYRIAGR